MMDTTLNTPANDQANTDSTAKEKMTQIVPQPKGEVGGSKGQEPTSFGDWQHAGRCSDF